jgi:hypothetical protein
MLCTICCELNGVDSRLAAGELDGTANMEYEKEKLAKLLASLENMETEEVWGLTLTDLRKLADEVFKRYPLRSYWEERRLMRRLFEDPFVSSMLWIAGNSSMGFKITGTNAKYRLCCAIEGGMRARYFDIPRENRESLQLPTVVTWYLDEALRIGDLQPAKREKALNHFKQLIKGVLRYLPSAKEVGEKKAVPPIHTTGEGAEPKKTTYRPKGVTLMQVSSILNDDEVKPARITKKRWQNSKGCRLPPPVGRSLRRRDEYLYEPSALCDFLEKSGESMRPDKIGFLKRLRTIAIPGLPM